MPFTEETYQKLKKFCIGPPKCLKLITGVPQSPFAFFKHADDPMCQDTACSTPIHLEYKVGILWDDEKKKWNFDGSDTEPCIRKEKFVDA